MTMVDGRILVEDGVLRTADLDAIIAGIRRLVPDHFARRAAFLADGGTVQWTQQN
jgi:5-methylthioadenosine/S-adenosylhomocysteine deaminase